MTAMTCEKLEAILPEYFEGDLSDEAKAAADAHLNSCASCSAIVADIDRITREASSLAPMRPARDLWSGIEERISAPVIPLAAPRKSIHRFGSAWMAAAAAALVVTTAGVTYLATTRMNEPRMAQVAVLSAKPVVPVADSNAANEGTPGASVERGSAKSAAPKNVAVAAADTRNQAAEKVTRPSATLASNTRASATPASAVPAMSLGSPQADAQYAKEIETLERMITSPASGLDPATVQVVKKNLQVIDDAIAQSKAALAKDPASPLLYDQVTRAMGRKVELLRTMASLSSSE